MFKKTLAGIALTIALLMGQAPQPAAAYNSAPAKDICTVFQVAWLGNNYYVSRWTDFNYLGQNIVGCTFRQYGGGYQFGACMLYNRHTGATAWVNCPTPP